MIRPQPKTKAVRLTGKAYHVLRMEAHTRAQGRCEECGTWTPLEVGHFAHIKSRGAGGSDELENGRWLCFLCHGAEHAGRPTYIGRS